MAALPFNNARQRVCAAAKRRDGVGRGCDPRPRQHASDDEIAVTFQKTEVDLSRDELTQKIESLNDPQKDALIFMIWIGRRDAELQQWEATKTPARQQHDGLVRCYLMGKPMVEEYLTEGLQKLVSTDRVGHRISCVTCKREFARGWVFRDGRQ